MLPRQHILWGAIFAFIIWIIIPAIGLGGFLIIFLSSFLIDVDHYVYYIFKMKEFNLKKSMAWFVLNRDKFEKMSPKKKKQIYSGLCFLHGIETLIILLVLSLVYVKFANIFLFVMLGFIFHQILDIIDMYRVGFAFDKVLSFTYAVIQSKNKRLLQEL